MNDNETTKSTKQPSNDTGPHIDNCNKDDHDYQLTKKHDWTVFTF